MRLRRRRQPEHEVFTLPALGIPLQPVETIVGEGVKTKFMFDGTLTIQQHIELPGERMTLSYIFKPGNLDFDGVDITVEVRLLREYTAKP